MDSINKTIRIKKINSEYRDSFGFISNSKVISSTGSISSGQIQDIVICTSNASDALVNYSGGYRIDIDLLCRNLFGDNTSSEQSYQELRDLVDFMSFKELINLLKDRDVIDDFITFIYSIIVTGVISVNKVSKPTDEDSYIKIKKYNKAGVPSYGLLDGGAIRQADSFKGEDVIISNKAIAGKALSDCCCKVLSIEDLADKLCYEYNCATNKDISSTELCSIIDSMDFDKFTNFLFENYIDEIFINMIKDLEKKDTTEVSGVGIVESHRTGSVSEGSFKNIINNGSKLKSDVDVEEPVELAKISKDGVITKYDVYLKSGRVVLSKCDSDTPAVILTASSINNGNKQFKAKMITPAVLANFVANNRGCSIFEKGMEESISSKSGEEFLVYLDGYNAISVLVKLVGAVIEL